MSGPKPPNPNQQKTSAPDLGAELVYDPINERIVIAAAIADEAKRAVLVRSISADEMLVKENAAVWRAMRTLVDQKLTYDPEVMRRLVRDEIEDFDELYLDGLETGASVPTNLEWHVSTLRWDATRARVLRGPIPELLRDIRDPKASPEQVSAIARAVLRSVEGGHGRKYIRRPDELKRSYKAELASRRAVGNFYSMGYAAVDERLVEGTMPGKINVLVGLPGSGKSTFAADMTLRLAKAGRRVLYCPWEMGTESTLDVMLSSMSRIELERIVQGGFSAEEQHRIGRCTDWIVDRVKFMDNAFYDANLRDGGRGFKRSNDRSLDVLEGYIAESGCDVVIMDLWERCLVDLSYDGVTAALYRQQQMAAEYRFYCVIVHQLRLKDVEKRADKRPTREAIKGTGAFVEVADQIYGVHRDAQFRNVPDDAIELICMKQRKGKANWAVRFGWDGSKALIEGDGMAVNYDPGLEDTEESGDIGSIRTSSGGGRRGKRSRRDG